MLDVKSSTYVPPSATTSLEPPLDPNSRLASSSWLSAISNIASKALEYVGSLLGDRILQLFHPPAPAAIHLPLATLPHAPYQPLGIPKQTDSSCLSLKKMMITMIIFVPTPK